MALRQREEYERKITPHWSGHIVRRKLGLNTEKRHGNYIVASSGGAKLTQLFERYSISSAGPFAEVACQFGLTRK